LASGSKEIQRWKVRQFRRPWEVVRA